MHGLGCWAMGGQVGSTSRRGGIPQRVRRRCLTLGPTTTRFTAPCPPPTDTAATGSSCRRSTCLRCDWGLPRGRNGAGQDRQRGAPALPSDPGHAGGSRTTLRCVGLPCRHRPLQYDAVVLVDSDTAVVGDLSPLFSLPIEFAASWDQPKLFGRWGCTPTWGPAHSFALAGETSSAGQSRSKGSLVRLNCMWEAAGMVPAGFLNPRPRAYSFFLSFCRDGAAPVRRACAESATRHPLLPLHAAHLPAGAARTGTAAALQVGASPDWHQHRALAGAPLPSDARPHAITAGQPPQAALHLRHRRARLSQLVGRESYPWTTLLTGMGPVDMLPLAGLPAAAVLLLCCRLAQRRPVHAACPLLLPGTSASRA